MPMNVRQSLFACGLAVLVGLLASLLLDRPSSGQQAASPPAVAGRYQFAVKSGPHNTAVFVFEPATGECWYRDTSYSVTEWTSMGSPVIKTKP